MKRWSLLLLLVCACATEPAPPADLLPPETFRAVLCDAQLVEARLNQELLLDHRNKLPQDKYYDELFRKHKVTKEAFRTTFDWYTEHPEELKAIYDSVLIDLQHKADSTTH